MGFSFGKEFRVTIFGESHGKVIGAVVDGCPAGLRLEERDIQCELERRRPGRGLVSGRGEDDVVHILSGVSYGKTNGGPILMLIHNKDLDSTWYERNRYIPRPGHADYTAFVKYGGHNDNRGGGFFSGRMTAGFVMAGSIAKKVLAKMGVRILAHMIQINGIKAREGLSDEEILENVAGSPVYCADRTASELMVSEIRKLIEEGDSTGGVIECRVSGLPVGLGEPIFDPVEGVLAHALFSIPGVKAVEFGSGFGLCSMRGSQSNDELYLQNGRVVTKTNHSGGVLGGITNGMPLIFRVGIKPTPSIKKRQRSVDLRTMEETEIEVVGRHDPCVAIRAVPVVECVTAFCLLDLMIMAKMIPKVMGEEDGSKGS
ncbi:MAG: chorismate synthase [Candidatus Methanomethyliales bacterium]|nr:chorismate synthase [Candidatus Methanomethylicales archaeon]